MNEKAEILLTPRETRNHFNVCGKTLYNWRKSGKIKTIKTNANQNRYVINKQNIIRRNICYCRVSTYGQKEDLMRQEQLLTSKYPDFECIKDIGSGLNFKRKGFKSILDAAIKGEIKTLVISYKDRLCRFGYPIIEELIKRSDGIIVVLNNEELSAEQELVRDLLTIITCFSSRLYGLRSHTIKKQIKEQIKEQTKEQIKNKNII